MRVVNGFGFTKHIPGAVFVPVANPGGKGAIDPASRDQMIERHRVQFRILQRRLVSRHLQPWMTADASVEGFEKVPGVFRVVLPGVFTIHDDGNYTGIRVIAFIRDAHQVVDQIAHGILGVPVGVLKADQIGQAVITEKTADRLLVEGVSAVQVLGSLFGIGGFFQTVVQHGVSRGGPGKPFVGKQLEGFPAERPFRCPTALRA